MDADDFSVTVEQTQAGPMVRIAGEIDMATAPLLRECLEGLDGQPVTLDFDAVTFLDSSGIQLLAAAARRAHEGTAGPVTLRNVRPNQLRVLEATYVINMLTIKP